MDKTTFSEHDKISFAMLAISEHLNSSHFPESMDMDELAQMADIGAGESLFDEVYDYGHLLPKNYMLSMRRTGDPDFPVQYYAVNINLLQKKVSSI